MLQSATNVQTYLASTRRILPKFPLSYRKLRSKYTSRKKEQTPLTPGSRSSPSLTTIERMFSHCCLLLWWVRPDLSNTPMDGSPWWNMEGSYDRLRYVTIRSQTCRQIWCRATWSWLTKIAPLDGKKLPAALSKSQNSKLSSSIEPHWPCQESLSSASNRKQMPQSTRTLRYLSCDGTTSD